MLDPTQLDAIFRTLEGILHSQDFECTFPFTGASERLGKPVKSHVAAVRVCGAADRLERAVVIACLDLQLTDVQQHPFGPRAADLAMLLDGVDLESVQRRKRYRRPATATTQ